MNLQIVGTHLPVEPLKDKIWLKAQHLEGALGIFEMFQNSLQTQTIKSLCYWYLPTLGGLDITN